MSGTSLDGLDVALIEISGEGRDLTAEYLEGRSVALRDTGEFLKGLASGGAATAREIAEASHEFTQIHVSAIRELIGASRVDLISAHGQTVYHDRRSVGSCSNPHRLLRPSVARLFTICAKLTSRPEDRVPRSLPLRTPSFSRANRADGR